MAEVVNPECKHRCPLVLGSLANAESSALEIAILRGDIILRTLDNIEEETLRNRHLKDPQNFEEFDDPFGSEEVKAEWLKIKKIEREELRLNRIEQELRLEWFSRVIARVAMISCEGEPVVSRWWGIVDREVMLCTSPIAYDLFFDVE